MEGPRQSPPVSGFAAATSPSLRDGEDWRTYSSHPVGDMYGTTMPIASISCICPPHTL